MYLYGFLILIMCLFLKNSYFLIQFISELNQTFTIIKKLHKAKFLRASNGWINGIRGMYIWDRVWYTYMQIVNMIMMLYGPHSHNSYRLCKMANYTLSFSNFHGFDGQV